MIDLSSRAFCPCDGRWVSLGYLSAGCRYTTPENIGGEWQDGGSGKVGDRYIGHNRTSERSWSVPVLVTVAERGRCFEFVTRPDEGLYVRWTYRLEASGAGTRVTEIWDEGVSEVLISSEMSHTNLYWARARWPASVWICQQCARSS